MTGPSSVSPKHRSKQHKHRSQSRDEPKTKKRGNKRSLSRDQDSSSSDRHKSRSKVDRSHPERKASHARSSCSHSNERHHSGPEKEKKAKTRGTESRSTKKSRARRSFSSKRSSPRDRASPLHSKQRIQRSRSGSQHNGHQRRRRHRSRGDLSPPSIEEKKRLHRHSKSDREANALVCFDDERLAAELTYKFNSGQNNNAGKEARKRKSRWTNSESEKIYIPGMPTTLPPNLTKDQEKAYILQLQIEELSRRLRLPNLGIPENPALRSPSPEPVYDQYGKRTNTRDARTRKKLEDDRHLLIQEMFKINPEYKPPLDYKPQQIRFTDKVEIPQDDFPEINFVGLLIGPRGNSLKSLEKETGAKIIIRGKGSVKDGKLARKEAGPLPGEDEPLHAYISGTNLEVVERATKRIKEIIQQGIEVPESMNELRRQQLRELALLNGTLRENECLNKLKILTEAETIVTNTIICPICGGAGHIASDCMMRGSLTKEQLEKMESEAVDTEYSALMKELGHTVAASQLKCLGNVVCSGALTTGKPALALTAPEHSEGNDDEAEITVVTKIGTLSNNVFNADIPPLMPSGQLVLPASASPAGSSFQPSNTITAEDVCSSFFVETAQKWIKDSVYTDPTMAIAAAALSQYAYQAGTPAANYWPYYSAPMAVQPVVTNTWYTPAVNSPPASAPVTSASTPPPPPSTAPPPPPPSSPPPERA